MVGITAFAPRKGAARHWMECVPWRTRVTAKNRKSGANRTGLFWRPRRRLWPKSNCSSATGNLSVATRGTTMTCSNYQDTRKSRLCSPLPNPPRSKKTTTRSAERISPRAIFPGRDEFRTERCALPLPKLAAVVGPQYEGAMPNALLRVLPVMGKRPDSLSGNARYPLPLIVCSFNPEVRPGTTDKNDC